MNQGKRIIWIDNSKGIGIILVIIGHLITQGFLHEWIFSFHMPLFFFLSGYVFKNNQTIKSFALKKAKTLLIPYLCLGLIITVWVSCTTDVDIYDNLIKLLLQERVWTIWFLTSLFLVNIIYYCLLKVVRNSHLITIMSILLYLIAILYYRAGGKAMIWNTDTVMVALFYFHVGFIFQKNNILTKINCQTLLYKAMAILAFLLINMVCVLYMYKNYGLSLNMYDNNYSNLLVVIIGSLAGILFVVLSSSIIKNIIIEYLGRNSIVYFALHQSVIMPLVIVYISPALSSFLCIEPHIWYWQITKVVLIFALLTICNEIIIKSKLRFILGKF